MVRCNSSTTIDIALTVHLRDMRGKITKRLIESLKPKSQAYEVRDIALPGFLVRIQPSGSMSYICQYDRSKRITISKTSILTPVQARDEATLILADVAKGIDPKKTRTPEVSTTFIEFINNTYEPWVKQNLKCGNEEIVRIKTKFKEFNDKNIKDINPWLLDKWKSKRLKTGINPITVNRDIASIKAAFSRAYKWGFLEINNLGKLTLCKVENELRVRYLSIDEENRLRECLKARDIINRTKRTNANKWREARSYKLMPNLYGSVYFDYLEPMVILSLNTGLRRGELLKLVWDDINLSEKILTVRAANSKSRKVRYIPLNDEAALVISNWRGSVASDKGFVFANKDGKPYVSIKKAWMKILSKAEISNFRWHDLRHAFASKLVMRGVDLNTVRELLGHSDLQMTLRYAHLAPEHKAKAVAQLLNSKN